jgi:hypothetical protein
MVIASSCEEGCVAVLPPPPPFVPPRKPRLFEQALHTLLCDLCSVLYCTIRSTIQSSTYRYIQPRPCIRVLVIVLQYILYNLII